MTGEGSRPHVGQVNGVSDLWILRGKVARFDRLYPKGLDGGVLPLKNPRVVIDYYPQNLGFVDHDTQIPMSCLKVSFFLEKKNSAKHFQQKSKRGILGTLLECSTVQNRGVSSQIDTDARKDNQSTAQQIPCEQNRETLLESVKSVNLLLAHWYHPSRSSAPLRLAPASSQTASFPFEYCPRTHRSYCALQYPFESFLPCC